MTEEQIRLVEASFRAVAPMRAEAAALFYERLFALEPGLRGLFGSADMTEQGGKLMASLAFVVAGLRRLDSILPQVRALAVRHLGYGVEERHYAVVGQALIETLAVGLGAAFTPEVRAAWQAAYGLLAGAMIAAAGAAAAAGGAPVPGRSAAA